MSCDSLHACMHGGKHNTIAIVYICTYFSLCICNVSKCPYSIDESHNEARGMTMYLASLEVGLSNDNVA